MTALPEGMELLHKDNGGYHAKDSLSCQCCPRLVTHAEAEAARSLGGYMPVDTPPEQDSIIPLEGWPDGVDPS